VKFRQHLSFIAAFGDLTNAFYVPGEGATMKLLLPAWDDRSDGRRTCLCRQAGSCTTTILFGNLSEPWFKGLWD